MEVRHIATIEDLEKEAARFALSLSPREGKATLVTLSGELGAGKTAFTKAVAKALGVTEPVTSPTFVLEKIYPLAPSMAFERLVHIDAYRLETDNSLAALGFAERMADPKNIILFEWPEQVADALPEPAVHISFEILPDESRKITYE
ncbi:MAG TPA: tRNA (adenosine(37)-N6)-threonylcarbamoyltransferase complex ATPase subunit type 1 TsaE [Candidatus Paceibacterota bacterium]